MVRVGEVERYEGHGVGGEVVTGGLDERCLLFLVSMLLRVEELQSMTRGVEVMVDE